MWPARLSWDLASWGLYRRQRGKVLPLIGNENLIASGRRAALDKATFIRACSVWWRVTGSVE
jgi:hypothetical protein